MHADHFSAHAAWGSIADASLRYSWARGARFLCTVRYVMVWLTRQGRLDGTRAGTWAASTCICLTRWLAYSVHCHCVLYRRWLLLWQLPRATCSPVQDVAASATHVGVRPSATHHGVHVMSDCACYYCVHTLCFNSSAGTEISQCQLEFIQPAQRTHTHTHTVASTA